MWLVIPTVPISEGLLPAQKRSKRMLKLNVYTYAIYAILLVILVPKFGLAGAIWSYILDRIFTFIYILSSVKNIKD
jgi:O-antigen/teichoic acid export membrane protein